MKEILEAVILGVIQGLTEFLPISSTAHLTLAGKLMGMIDPVHPEHWTAAIAVIQLGTLTAVFAYFFKDILHIINGFYHDVINKVTKKTENKYAEEGRLGWLIIAGTIPVVIIGLLFKKTIEGSLTKNLYVIAGSMFALAILLLIAELVSKRRKSIKDITFLGAIFIGFAQSLALIPGSSRSGTTITAGLFTGLNRESAAKFSFLLSLPSVFASGLLELVESLKEIQHSSFGYVHLLIATVVSCIVGYLSIWFLLKYLKTHSTALFIVYRVFLGGIIIVLLLTNIIYN